MRLDNLFHFTYLTLKFYFAKNKFKFFEKFKIRQRPLFSRNNIAHSLSIYLQ